MEQTTASLEKTTITDKAATVQQVLPQLPASPSSSTSTEQIKEANNLIPKIMEDTIKKDLTEESFGPWNIVKRKSRKNLNNSAKFVQLNPKIKGGDFKLANHANMHDPTCMLPRDHRKDGNRSGESVMPSNNKGMGCVENVEQKSNNSSSDRTNKNTSATQPVNQRVRNTLGGKNPQRKQHKEGKNLERKYASPLKPSFIPKGKITPKPLVNATETIKVDRVDRQENFQILENIKIMERNIPKDFVFSSLPSDPMVDAMVETDAETLAFAEKLKNQRETNVKSPTPISHKKNGVGEMEIEEKNLHSGGKLFPALVKDIFSIYQLDFLAILEPRISGRRADVVIKKIGLFEGARVEAQGFSGAGDFNQVLFDHEKQGGGSVNSNGRSAFQECIDTCQLLDLGFQGQPFTWRRGPVKERLDRVLGNADWQNLFPNSNITHLPINSSDHSGLWLSDSFLEPLRHLAR
ncbi:hypothetical protein P8452_07957 [Trifolium repens]|nr:hypothetical protein P8452_07957 [Trifolium repens]